MICFRDMTFCAARCATIECHRRWTNDLAQQARAWWGGGEGAPVAMSDFSRTCPDFRPEEDAAVVLVGRSLADITGPTPEN